MLTHKLVLMVETLLYRAFFTIFQRGGIHSQNLLFACREREQIRHKNWRLRADHSPIFQNQCFYLTSREEKYLFGVWMLFGIARKSDHGIILQNWCFFLAPREEKYLFGTCVLVGITREMQRDVFDNFHKQVLQCRCTTSFLLKRILLQMSIRNNYRHIMAGSTIHK